MQKVTNDEEISSGSSYENLISAESYPLSTSPAQPLSNIPNSSNTAPKMRPEAPLKPNKNDLNPNPSKFQSIATPQRKGIVHAKELYESVISPQKSVSSIKSFKYAKSKGKKPGKVANEFQRESIIIFAKFRKLFSNFEQKTNLMAKDFEDLSKELMERMEVFNQSKQRFDLAQATSNRIEMSIDQNHLKIQKLSDALKWSRGRDFSDKSNRQVLRKKLGPEKEWLPFKTKKQVHKENLDLFKGHYQKRQIILER